MRELNVVVTGSIEDECLRQIADVSPEIKLWDASDLAVAEQNGDFTSREKFDAMLAQAEVLYGFWPPRNLITRAPRLK